MKVCRVAGTVVGAAHHPAYDGKKLMVVQPLDEHGAEKGPSYLAIDTVQAGRGDLVLVATEGNGARQILKMGAVVPIRSLIVGIIDAVEVAE